MRRAQFFHMTIPLTGEAVAALRESLEKTQSVSVGRRDNGQLMARASRKDEFVLIRLGGRANATINQMRRGASRRSIGISLRQSRRMPGQPLP